MILDSPAGSWQHLPRQGFARLFLGETENLLIEIGLLKRQAVALFQLTMDLAVAHPQLARQATHRQLGAARLLAVVADKVAVERQFYPLAFTTAFWKAALRLAYQPALKSAKRYNGAL